MQKNGWSGLDTILKIYILVYKIWRLKITMNWAMFPMLPLYLRYLNDRSNQLEMAQENFSGLDNKEQTDDGLDSTVKSWPQKEHSTLTKYTLGPSTITIRTTSIRPQLNEICSSTTTQPSSDRKMEDGSLRTNVSTSSQPSISHIRQGKGRITQR